MIRINERSCGSSDKSFQIEKANVVRIQTYLAHILQSSCEIRDAEIVASGAIQSKCENWNRFDLSARFL